MMTERRASVLAICAAIAVASACVPRDRSDQGVERAATRPDIELPRELRIVSARVSARATLPAVLRASGLAEGDVAAVVARAASIFDLRKLRAAQPYRIEQGAGGVLRRFEYEIDADRYLRVMRSGAPDAPPSESDELVAELLPIEKARAMEVVRGTIDRATPSLFAAMEAAGETVDLSVALADIFSAEIDFNIDVQPGDRFELLVEKQYRAATDADALPSAEGDRAPKAFAGYGPILAAEFNNAGRRYRAVRFTPQGSAPGYYDERGVSLRRFFLRSPLKFVPVVTSGFSRNRFHPILREYRAHLGVDYRAPAGAPVIAVADGVVVESGAKDGSGRIVHLRHPNNFESEYVHLSSIAVRRGARVRQGDLIGRVGATGLATGPHLDYRLKKNGVFINPVTAHRSMPPADPVPAPQLAAFFMERDRAFAGLATPPVASASAPVTGPQQ